MGKNIDNDVSFWPFEEQDGALSKSGLTQWNGRIFHGTNGFNILFSDMPNPQTREEAEACCHKPVDPNLW